MRRCRGAGRVAIAASAVGYGVGTALSVVALHGLRPADLLAIELAGSATVLLAFAAATGRLRREGAGRALPPPAWQFLGATLAVLPFAPGSWWTGGSRITTAEPHQLAAAAAVLLCGLGALLAFNIGIGTVSASRAGLLYTLQPLAGALTAVALLGEPVVAGQAFGAALILACLVVLTRAEPTDHPTPTPAADADAVQTTR